MKKSELKALIREVIEEVRSGEDYRTETKQAYQDGTEIRIKGTEVVEEMNTNESWKGGAKAIGLAGAIAGLGVAGYYADKNAPKVEVGGQIATVVPEDHGKVPHKTAMKLKASDGKMYKVWSDKQGHYYAYPLEK